MELAPNKINHRALCGVIKNRIVTTGKKNKNSQELKSITGFRYYFMQYNNQWQK